MSDNTVPFQITLAFHPPGGNEPEPTVYYGARIATFSFLHALFTESTEPVTVIIPKHLTKQALNWLENFTGSRENPLVAFKEVDRLLQKSEQKKISVWHHPEGATKYLPFQMRNNLFRKPFPVTLTHHTLSYRECLYSFFLRLAMEGTYPFDTIVCTSTSAKKVIQNYFDAIQTGLMGKPGKNHGAPQVNLEVIPFGIDTKIFRPLPVKSSRSHFNLPHDAFILLFIGRLSAMDKADLLPFLRVLKKLVIKNPALPIKFVIAGKEAGNNTSAVADYAGELGMTPHLLFINAISQKDLPLLYSASDIFLSPADSIQEMFGLTPLEAMACGTPQIVADWDGYRDTVVNGKTGFCIPTCMMKELADISLLASLPYMERCDELAQAQSVVIDMELLEKAIQELIDKPDLRKTMSGNSRERALKHYRWDKIIQRYICLWHEVAHRALDYKHCTEKPAHLYIPPLAQLFAGHASEHIHTSSLIRISPGGADILEGKAGLPLYNVDGIMLNDKVICKILNRLSEMKDWIAIDELILYPGRGSQKSKAGNRADYFKDFTARHIMWLYKYGYIELAKHHQNNSGK